MAGKKHNSKLPKDPVSNTEIEPKYGYVHGEWDAVGGHHFSYVNPEEPDKFYHQKVHASGSYQTTQHDSEDKEIHTNLNPGETRSYVAGGKSSQVDGHMDTNCESTIRTEVSGDMSSVSGKDFLQGVKNNVIKIVGQEARFTANGSGGSRVSGYTGDYSQTVEQDRVVHVKKNNSLYVEGNQINKVEKDVAYNVGKNWDNFISEKGKIETGSDMIFKSGATINATAISDIKIKSDSKITLEVGGSSIVIESGSITIKSAQIKFQQG